MKIPKKSFLKCEAHTSIICCSHFGVTCVSGEHSEFRIGTIDVFHARKLTIPTFIFSPDTDKTKRDCRAYTAVPHFNAQNHLFEG